MTFRRDRRRIRPSKDGFTALFDPVVRFSAKCAEFRHECRCVSIAYEPVVVEILGAAAAIEPSSPPSVGSDSKLTTPRRAFASALAAVGRPDPCHTDDIEVVGHRSIVVGD
jgi:hypothetical protein